MLPTKKVQLTLASEQQEKLPWRLAFTYVLVDLSSLAECINSLLRGASKFESPKLAVAVNNPTTMEWTNLAFVKRY